MKDRPEDEHSRNVDKPLTGDIDDQGFRRRAAGLQRIGQHIEYAKQETGAKENAGKGNAIVIRRRIREEYADDLSGKEIADQRQHGAEEKAKYQREFEGASVTLPVFRTDTITEQRLNALPKSDTNHACHHCNLHGNAHTGYRHIAVFCHLTVHEDAGKAHQKISQGSRNADCQNTGGNLFLHGKVLEADAEGGRAFQEVDNVISRAHHISDDSCNGCTGKPSDFFKKNTHPAPNTVPRNGSKMP